MTITTSAFKANWQGAYAGGTAYVVNDVVSYLGNSYTCILASTGNVPTNTTYFKPMAEGSDLGSSAVTGDVAYYNGSNWVRKALGGGSEVFQVNSAGNGLEFGTAAAGTLKQVKHYRKNSTIDNSSASDSVVGAPFDGSNGITPSASGNFIACDFMTNIDHGTTWRSGFDRLQFSTDGGSTWKDICGAGDSEYGSSSMHGNCKYIYGVIPTQNTTNEHKIRVVHNAHSSGNSRRMGQFAHEGQDDGNNSNPSATYYSSGMIMTIYEYDSSGVSVTETG